MNALKKDNSTLFFILILAFTFLCFFYYDALWSALGIGIVKPIFNDSRVITAGAESYYQGFDPLISNPMMWSKNPMNYPRVWHSLFYFGLNQNHTLLVGYFMLACYLSALLLLLKSGKNTLSHLLITCCAISPAAMLGVERGNIDLLIFLMVTISAVYVNRRPLLAAFILISSTVLKIFPFFCLPMIVMASTKKNLVRIFVISTLACMAYFALTYHDLMLISESTPRAGDISYGRSVFAIRLKGYIPPDLSSYVDIVINTLFVLATAFSYFASRKLLQIMPQDLDALDGKGFFLAGALVYVGTFFIGNNWDYRLIFLMLTIPTLASSLKTFSSNTARLCSKFFITALLLSFWYLFFAKYLNDFPLARIALYFFDETVDWIIYILCMSFLFKFLSFGFENEHKQ